MSFIPSLSRLSRKTIFAGALALSTLMLGGCVTDLLTSPATKARQDGIQLYNNNQYAEAAGAFTNVVKQQPQDYVAHYYLGRTYEAMKNYHQAIKSYRTALTVMANSLAGPEDKEFHNKVLDGLASAIAAGNDISLESMAFVNPQAGAQTAEDHFVLAKIRRLQKDPDSAIEEYNKAATADPKNVAVAKEEGLYLLQLNQRTRAAQELKRAYVLNRRAYKEDEQVTEALRKLDIVPGPSLGEEADLAQPIIPEQLVPNQEPAPASGKTSRQVSSNAP